MGTNIILDHDHPFGKVLEGICNGRRVEYCFSARKWRYVDTKEIIPDGEVKNWTVDGAVLRRMK